LSKWIGGINVGYGLIEDNVLELENRADIRVEEDDVVDIKSYYSIIYAHCSDLEGKLKGNVGTEHRISIL
jgi:hypothetical protein